MGYEWHPVFRQTPENGSEVVVDTRLAFSDLGGPHRVEVSYRPDQRKREDVNRRARNRTFGFRMNVNLHIYIDTMSDHVHLADILNRMAREDWLTELSLDGAGSYYEVALEDFKGPNAFRGKTIAGAEFELPMRSVDLLSEVPYLSTLLIPIPTAYGTALPVASGAYKWILWTVDGGTGAPDGTYQCLRDYLGNWSWVSIASG